MGARRFGPRGLLAASLLLLVAGLAWGAAAQADEEPGRLDLIRLRSGNEVTGIVESADAESVVIRRGSVETGLSRVTLARADVLEILYGQGAARPDERASPDRRERLREEHFLLRSEGRIVGTRRLSVQIVRGGDDPGFRLEEERVWFAQGRHVPAAQSLLTETTDLELHLLRTAYREESRRPDGGRWLRAVTGRVASGVWSGTAAEGERREEHEVRVPQGVRGRLGAREHLLRRRPRVLGLEALEILDGAEGALLRVTAGFVRDAAPGLGEPPGTPAPPRERADEFHWEEGGVRLPGYFEGDERARLETVAEGIEALAASLAQVEAAQAEDRRAEGAGATAEGQPGEPGIVRLPEAGLRFRLPDAAWRWRAQTAAPVHTGMRVLGSLRADLHAANARIEWHPEGARTAPGPAAARDWLLRRLGAVCPDLQTVQPLSPLPGLGEAWRLVVSGTLKGDTPVRTVAVVIDRGPARLLILIACPERAWAEARAQVAALIDSLELL